MTTIYLIRHAEAEGNLYRRAHGHYDSPITDRGYLQIAALSRRFDGVHFDAVYASDLIRTQTTALSIADPRGLPIQTDPALREVGIGVWEDRTWVYLVRFEKEGLALFNTDAHSWRVPGGEDMETVRARMLGALRRIVDAHPDQTVAVFSHGMAIRLTAGTLQGLTIEEIDKTPHSENTSVCKIEAEGGDMRVVFRDDASHLTDEISTLRRQKWLKNKNGFEEGIWFLPSDEEGRFDVMHGTDVVGGVAVSLDGSLADIDEYWLGESVQGKGYGVGPLGQAISYARAHGADTLCAMLPRSDPRALAAAVRFGFAPVWSDAESILYQKYVGTEEGYRLMKFREALKHS